MNELRSSNRGRDSSIICSAIDHFALQQFSSAGGESEAQGHGHKKRRLPQRKAALRADRLAGLQAAW
ncbi:MAG: hypothetical protein CMI02_05350 [Oceanospirillaceae bacterium]|nr:hypothetical protein [Oceanospirillaceae bacterium]MBT11444.1 hypothetical protein [Oceanospirillaceae bacterium]